MKNHLMIVDPQNCFCFPGESLYVTNADRDMSNVAKMIIRLNERIYEIHVTLDSHHLIDIAHPIFWVNSQGTAPDPFTIITRDDVLNGVWMPSIPAYLNRTTMKTAGIDRDGVVEYVTTLEKNGRYPLCIWPPHGLIGSFGTQVFQELLEALWKWEKDNYAMVNFVTKGSNFMTEHYSAVQADVPDPEDPNTHLNEGLIEILKTADEIIWTGEALSHCVANTIEDIANNFGEENIKRMILLIDATSNVTGYDQLGKDLVKKMVGRGMRTSTTVEYMK